jgi:hypothetical protein
MDYKSISQSCRISNQAGQSDCECKVTKKIGESDVIKIKIGLKTIK